jgi:hypothetical protein
VSTSTEAWPDSRLEALRKQGDPEIDGLLAHLRGMTADEMLTLYVDFVRTQLELRSELWPAELLDWWDDAEPLPEWADQAKIRRAVAFSERWLPELLVAYLLDSLPNAYAGARGAMALRRISLLGNPQSLMRRVLETLLFVLRVNAVGGLEPGGDGIELTKKTRIFHGLVRVMITEHAVDVRRPDGIGAPWDVERDGMPVNQEDLLGTLWTFAITTIQRLEHAGASISEADKDAVTHLWCVIGHFLGIGVDCSPPLLPMSYAEAAHCWARIQEHQFAASPEGAELTAALIARCRELVPVPGLRGLPGAAIYDNLGPRVAGYVGLDDPGPILYAVQLGGLLYRVSHGIPGGTLVQTPMRHFLKRFVGQWLRLERSDGRPAITLPEEQRRKLVPLYIGPKARNGFPSTSAAR